MTPTLTDTNIVRDELARLRALGSDAAQERAAAIEREAEVMRRDELREADHLDGDERAELDRLEAAYDGDEPVVGDEQRPASGDFASDDARDAAVDAGLDADEIEGTGKDGAITVKDVRRAAK